MELALLVYAVETLTYNGNSLAYLAWLVAIGLLVCFGYKMCIESKNRPETTVRSYGGTGTGQTFCLSTDHRGLKAGVEYTVERNYTDGDVAVVGVRPSDGYSSYFRNKALVDIISASPVVLPAIDKRVNVKWKLATFFACTFMTLHVFLPTKQTAYYIAGAYMVQQVLTSETTKELGSLAVDATKAQLKAWATQSPQLAALMVQSGINEAKAAVKQEAIDKL